MIGIKQLLKKHQKIIVQVTSLIGIFLTILLVLFIINSGFFSDPLRVQEWIAGYGSIGPWLFLALTYIQVVIPIMPGNVSTVVGIMLFGIGMGSFLNILGIFLGSVTNFYLARKFGRAFAGYFVKQQTYDKYIGWVNKGKRFERFFVISMIFPGFPDDFICLIAGLTKMTWRKFIFYFLLAKPVTLFIYTLFAIYGLDFLYNFVHSLK
ncbi:TVP38/TMEM64 family protein [Oceanobacillus piezotolerans]|uniref:TVP38/TMEM64 family membrane protein n=1 Tax=Oceanobacillus piezotolerans TaxID=2448030 RepID=A0A498DC04_9BACI|nr:VTT domain-containing protein [Oceanobacillus piezotolerans]RLL47762.1 TVP38/TMEM64 family protein [Oceanobacillus piezotolerans]